MRSILHIMPFRRGSHRAGPGYALICVLMPGSAAVAAEPRSTTHWSFQSLRNVAVPRVDDPEWPRTEIDRFILARLTAEGLRPALDAGRRVLIRRVYFDLVGLPPSPTEVRRFIGDPATDAFARVVDRLLASPQFGERWGRHWLDVARYAESSGGGRSQLFVNAWRYRDYVINALAADKPYDRFVTEQLAGDLLPYADPKQRHDQLVATGFLAIGPKNLDNQDKEGLRMDVVDEQIDSMGKTFLGLTLGCARCHDHKSDPIPTTDYYALAGIFRSTKTLLPGNVSGFVQTPLPISAAHEQALSRHEHARKTLRQRLKDAGKERKALQSKLDRVNAGTAPLAADAAVNDAEAVSTLVRQVKALERQLERLERNAPPPRPLAMAVRDEAEPGDTTLCIAGNVHTPGESVARGFLTVARMVDPPVIRPGQSGRRALAAWMTRPDHPLTCRVIVNRVWHHLFGAGLVRSVDNFGTSGELPSHPDLLDWLAVHFQEDGWSIKATIRRIVLSRVYQLSSRPLAPHRAGDPENRLLARTNRRRLDAECIRDAILTVSGSLDSTRGGPVIRDGTKTEFNYAFGPIRRRSVYLPTFRNTPHALLDVFDCADPNTVVGRRTVSTVPTQALYFLNSPFVIDQARIAAVALLTDTDDEVSAALDLAYARTLGRPPKPQERSVALHYIRQADGGDLRDASERTVGVWSRFQQALFSCIDFRYVE